MKFSDRRISSNDTDLNLKRTERNNWGKTIEDDIIMMSPYPITYDVNCTQPANFSEYTYTEFISGVFIKTQSKEINCRIMDLAKDIPAKKDHLENIRNSYMDKYESQNINSKRLEGADVCFFVGHNLFDIMNREMIAREAFENENFFVKLHPLTNDEYAGKIAGDVGWNKIIPQEISAKDILLNCNKVFTSTASELCTIATAFDKEVINVSSFFNESVGTYYSINKLLHRSNDPQQTLNNLIDCEFSGILFPWMGEEEIKRRILAFYQKTLELREIYKPLATSSNI